jgi:hypothetical protein
VMVLAPAPARPGPDRFFCFFFAIRSIVPSRC